MSWYAPCALAARASCSRACWHLHRHPGVPPARVLMRHAMLPPARTYPPPLSELHLTPCALCPVHSMPRPMMHTPCQVPSRCTPLTRCAGFSSAGSTMKPVVHPTSGPCLAGLAASGCACAPQSVRSRMAGGPAKRPQAGAAGSGACLPAGRPCWEPRGLKQAYQPTHDAPLARH